MNAATNKAERMEPRPHPAYPATDCAAQCSPTVCLSRSFHVYMVPLKEKVFLFEIRKQLKIHQVLPLFFVSVAPTLLGSFKHLHLHIHIYIYIRCWPGISFS